MKVRVVTNFAGEAPTTEYRADRWTFDDGLLELWLDGADEPLASFSRAYVVRVERIEEESIT